MLVRSVTHSLSGLDDSFNGPLVSCATAKIASKRRSDVFFLWLRILKQETIGSHKHPGRAYATLEGRMPNIAILQHDHRFLVFQALYSPDFLTSQLGS
jgi:hypothetical protein